MIKQIVKEHIILAGSGIASYEARIDLGVEVKKIEGYYVQVLANGGLIQERLKVSFANCLFIFLCFFGFLSWAFLFNTFLNRFFSVWLSHFFKSANIFFGMALSIARFLLFCKIWFVKKFIVLNFNSFYFL